MDAYFIFLLLVVVFIVFFSGFFSASEISMMSLNRYRLRHLTEQGNKRAIRVSSMLQQPDRVLSVSLIGNTLANIVASMLVTLMVQPLYGELGVFISTVILTIAILIISEMTPKTLAALYPEQVALACSLTLKYMQTFFSPIVWLMSVTAKGVLRLCGVSIQEEHSVSLSGEELRVILHEAEGFLPIEHKRMLVRLLDLEQARVEDIMIPKTEIIGVDIAQPWGKIIEQFEMAQYTRLPLYRDNMESLIGVVHLRSVFNLLLDDELNEENLIALAETPYFVPAATPLNVQVSNFQKTKRRSCFVVNEYGDLQGLVTMEDILEEVVGEFTTNLSDLGKDIIRQDDGSMIVDGSITLHHLNRLAELDLPSLGPRTLSGLIIEHLGYIPPADCCLRIDDLCIEILRVGYHLIKSVRISPIKK